MGKKGRKPGNSRIAAENLKQLILGEEIEAEGQGLAHFCTKEFFRLVSYALRFPHSPSPSLSPSAFLFPLPPFSSRKVQFAGTDHSLEARDAGCASREIASVYGREYDGMDCMLIRSCLRECFLDGESRGVR